MKQVENSLVLNFELLLSNFVVVVVYVCCCLTLSYYYLYLGVKTQLFGEYCV